MAHDVTIKEETIHGEHVTTRIGYQGWDQAPLVLVYNEYRGYPGAPVYYADVLYVLDPLK